MKGFIEGERSVVLVVVSHIIVVLSIGIVTGCQNPSIDTGISTIESDPVVIEYEELIMIQEEKKAMELKAIAVYDAYFMLNGKLKGISGKSIIDVDVVDTDGNAVTLDTFFRKDGKLYMSKTVAEQGDAIADTDPVEYEAVENTYCFRQEGETISVIESLPDTPIDQRSTMIDGAWSIQDGTYNGTEISQVIYKHPGGDTLPCSYLSIDGYCLTDNGLFYSVNEGISGAEKGVYFWESETKRHPKVAEYGRIF